MIQKRLPRKKQLTVQPKRTQENSLNGSIAFDNVFQDSITVKGKHHITTSVLPGIKPPKFERKQMKKHITVLDEMGFATYLQTNADINSEDAKHLKRRFSIGISEFWTDHVKSKFLRGKGYWEAYKALQKDDLKTEIKRQKCIRKPTLPYIMDANANRRVTSRIELLANGPATERNQGTRFRLSEDFAIKGEATPSRKLNIINSVMNKCAKLAVDTLMLQKSTDKLKNNLSKQFGDLNTPTRGISKYEKGKITMDVEYIL